MPLDAASRERALRSPGHHALDLGTHWRSAGDEGDLPSAKETRGVEELIPLLNSHSVRIVDRFGGRIELLLDVAHEHRAIDGVQLGVDDPPHQTRLTGMLEIVKERAAVQRRR